MRAFLAPLLGLLLLASPGPASAQLIPFQEVAGTSPVFSVFPSATPITTNCGAGPFSSCSNSASIPVTNGDKLIIREADCPGDNSCTVSGTVTLSNVTITGGLTGTCVVSTLQHRGASVPLGLAVAACPVTATGTLSAGAVTANFSAATHYPAIEVADVPFVGADEGIGNYCSGTGTSLPCALASNSTAPDDFIVSVGYTATAPGVDGFGVGYTSFNPGSWSAYNSDNVPGANGVTLTASQNGGTTSPLAAAVVAFKTVPHTRQAVTVAEQPNPAQISNQQTGPVATIIATTNDNGPDSATPFLTSCTDPGLWSVGAGSGNNTWPIDPAKSLQGLNFQPTHTCTVNLQ